MHSWRPKLSAPYKPDALQYVQRVLAMCGADVRTGNCAADALTAVREFHPDVLISDIGMPDVDGYQLIEQIHKLSRNLPAIALTAFARSEDRSRSLRAGFSTHISKPVEPAELVAAVAKVAAGKQAPPPSRA